MTSQPGKQTIAIHILPNTSRSKGNQTIESGQLIDYDIRNIFLVKSCTKFGGKITPRPFFMKIEHISGSIVESFIVCLSCMPSLELSKDIETKLQTTCFYLI